MGAWKLLGTTSNCNGYYRKCALILVSHNHISYAFVPVFEKLIVIGAELELNCNHAVVV